MYFYDQTDLHKSRGGGVHSHWKVVWGRAALKTPFFRPNFSSGDPTLQAFFPLPRPHLNFLKKSCILRPILPIFSSWDTHFRKNSFQRPYFWKPGRHVPNQNFWRLPPPDINSFTLTIIGRTESLENRRNQRMHLSAKYYFCINQNERVRCKLM